MKNYTKITTSGVDTGIQRLQLALSARYDWLTTTYGRIEKHEGMPCYPVEVRKTNGYPNNYDYVNTLPDDKEKGIIYFEQIGDIEYTFDAPAVTTIRCVCFVDLRFVDIGTKHRPDEEIRNDFAYTVASSAGLNIQSIILDFDTIFQNFDFDEETKTNMAPYLIFAIEYEATYQPQPNNCITN